MMPLLSALKKSHPQDSGGQICNIKSGVKLLFSVMRDSFLLKRTGKTGEIQTRIQCEDHRFPAVQSLQEGWFLQNL